MAKKIPMRMCIGCGEMQPKKELIRVVKSPEGEISLDFTGKRQDAAHTFAAVRNACPAHRKAADWKKAFPVECSRKYTR